MRKSSIPLTIMEMKTKTTIKYHYIPTKMVKVKGTKKYQAVRTDEQPPGAPEFAAAPRRLLEVGLALTCVICFSLLFRVGPLVFSGRSPSGDLQRTTTHYDSKSYVLRPTVQILY